MLSKRGFLGVIWLFVFTSGFGAWASDPGETLGWGSPAPFVAGDDELEKQLGPWLELRAGGQATGPAQGPVKVTHPDGSVTDLYGGLVDGSTVPARSDFIAKLSPRSEDSYGTGIMISLLMNASAEFSRSVWPGHILWVGEISQKNGGYMGHKSHQNGLDADLAYIGTRDFRSLINPDGSVSDKFDRERNWIFWKMLYGQRILDHGKIRSVVSMILVDPRLKAAMCDWAKEKNLLEDPESIEILRRIRPTVDHDDHFHLRLHCSPYYPLCLQDGDPRPGTGCE